MENRTDLLSSGINGGAGFGGFGGGGIGAFGLVGLIGLLGRDGLGRGGEDNCQRDLLLMSKLGAIEGAIPTAALQTQNALLEQTIGLNGQIGAVKDTIQNSVLALSTQAANNTQQLASAICGLGSKIDQNLISQLQTELLEERGRGRARETEVNVTQNVNQQQAQLQAQAQFNSLVGLVHTLAGEIQNQRFSNKTVQFGAGNVATPTNNGQQVG